MTKNRSPGGKCLLPAAAFLAGALAILGGGAVLSATDTASFCASCHVMAEAAWTHKQSAHAKQACNECHIPHNGAAYMLAYKAKTGISDIVVNTFMDVADNIEVQAGMKNVIKANCVRCHYATVREVNMDVKAYCTDCHRSLPHMNKVPLDKRRAADV
ncbi:MAG: NapC/NirT family cytochrome c [Deltaproteobacteria bacterium]|jgi:cytochrome c nitrite reductase small subunit|nr:NapC/NirT family cytochrome c [Deltaproteobacteria bacterium]